MKKLITILTIVAAVNLAAQVGIGTETPDQSAMLDVESTEKGFLPPRLTTAQRDAINGGTFTEGLVIYNTDIDCLQFWNATEWVSNCDGVGNPGDGEDPGGEDPGDEDPETEWTLTSVASYNGAYNTPDVIFNPTINNGMGCIEEFMDPASTITLNVNVTEIGPYHVTYTHEDSGITFSASGTFTSTGDQTITLTNNELYIASDLFGALPTTLDTNASNTLDIQIFIDMKSLPVNQTQIVEVTSATGKVWMDRNLGARRVPATSGDWYAGGSMFQWGRNNDGHEITIRRANTGSWLGRPLSTTSTLSPTDVPGHSNFILTTSANNNDWRVTRNDNLWQGVSGVNNPCPSGFRVPTRAEFEAEITQYGITTLAGAYATPMKFSTTGNTNHLGQHVTTGSLGFSNAQYWTSTAITGGIPGALNRVEMVQFNNGQFIQVNKGAGYAVRCIKN